jgi:putative transposase
MPRRSRCQIAGVPMHVIQRGNDRNPCFHSESDRNLYLAVLRELCDLYECSVHAYVLMTNHVHVLVTPEHSDSISLVMKHLGQRYVQYVNRRYARTGTLWEGRFRSSMVDSTGYFMLCQRYIELNPVRAGMVTRPHQYPWSSHGANAFGHRSDLVVPRAEYLSLGDTDAERQREYRKLFESDLVDAELKAIRDAVNGGFALGGQSFVDSVEAQLGRRAIRARPGRPVKRQFSIPD